MSVIILLAVIAFIAFKINDKLGISLLAAIAICVFAGIAIVGTLAFGHILTPNTPMSVEQFAIITTIASLSYGFGDDKFGISKKILCFPAMAIITFSAGYIFGGCLSFLILPFVISESSVPTDLIYHISLICGVLGIFFGIWVSADRDYAFT